MTALAIELQTYFTVFAHTQRDLAANTISSYRDTWRMLIRYLSESTSTRAERIDFTDVDAEAVSAFLEYLQTERVTPFPHATPGYSRSGPCSPTLWSIIPSMPPLSPASWQCHLNATRGGRCWNSSPAPRPTL